eukprot:scaffold1466_cov159-Amphora_coffeaeformis.AAC.6
MMCKSSPTQNSDPFFHIPLLAFACLGRDIRREYDEAVLMAPDLVANETKLIDFLRTEDMNVWKAAARFCLYWKYRRQIFGVDRWLRKMTQTGHGALSSDDVAMLRTGYTALVVQPCGSTLAVIDLSRLSVFANDANTRIIFYLATVATNERSQTEGIDILHCVSGAPLPLVDTDPEGWNMIRQALPMKVKQILVAQAYDPWKDALLDSLSYQVTRTAAFKTKRNPNRIQGTSVQSVIDGLEARGIGQQFVPQSLGGGYDYAVFANWTRMRLSVEDIMGSVPVAHNAMFGRMGGPLQDRLPIHDCTPSTRANKGVPVSPRPRQLRIMATPHGQGKRPRIAVNISQVSNPGALELVQQRTELEQQNQAFREENQRLERLLALARMFVPP